MKKTLLSLSIMTLFIIAASGILQAQSDKELIKTSNKALKDKDYDLAFKTITTAAKPKDSKVQDILKASYPNVINGIFKKITTIKITDKDDDNAKIEKYEQIISILQEGSDDDGLLRNTAAVGLYKTLTKGKKIESAIASNNIKLKPYKDKIAQQEQLVKTRDSLKQDSISKLKPVDTTTNKKVATTTPKTNESETTTVKQTEPIKTETNNSENTETKGTVSTATVTSTVSATTQPTSGGKKYYIITGSYRTEADAQAIVDKLKSQGYGAEITGKNAYGNYRVSYNSYTSAEEAKKELEKIKDKIQADTWILEQ